MTWPSKVRVLGAVAAALVLTCLTACSNTAPTSPPSKNGSGPQGTSSTPPLPERVTQYLESYFPRYDADSNGVWEGDELKKVKIGDPQKIDQDGDGKVTRDELFAWYAEKYPPEEPTAPTETVEKTTPKAPSAGIRPDPRTAMMYAKRAWTLATSSDASQRDGKRAVEEATKACELTQWKDDQLLGTLAAAYAEAGDFDQAIKWLTKAMEMNPTSHVDIRKQMLALFRAGKPYHVR